MHWDILDDKRKAILSKLALLRGEGFYLAGGTGLALHLGHRDSVDFDFFKEGSFDTAALFQKARKVLGEDQVTMTQEAADTLSIETADGVRLSFFAFPYKLVEPPTDTEFFPVASVKDIACMKLGAISSRSELKDYVDLYFIFKTESLGAVLEALKEKMPSMDPLLALKALVYFEDIKPVKIIFKSRPVSLSEIKAFFIKTVKEYQKY